jgi:hypothetical protein
VIPRMNGDLLPTNILYKVISMCFLKGRIGRVISSDMSGGSVYLCQRNIRLLILINIYFFKNT